MSEQQKQVFKATDEAKGQAKQLRMFAIIAWAVAIGGEIFAILKLISNEMLTWLIVAMVGILILSIVGSVLWKKANRLDPASEKDKARFFFQNQLGAIIAAIAFLPLIILVLTNKNLDGKAKGIAGAVGAVALLIAVAVGIDFNPPSVEKYTEQINAQTEVVENLIGSNHVYWAVKSGQKLHLYEDCQYVRDTERGEGTVKDAWDARKIGDNEICSACEKRAVKNKDNGDLLNQGKEIIEDVLENVTQD